MPANRILSGQQVTSSDDFEAIDVSKISRRFRFAQSPRKCDYRSGYGSNQTTGNLIFISWPLAKDISEVPLDELEPDDDALEALVQLFPAPNSWYHEEY
jgi:hypothetical protein